MTRKRHSALPVNGYEGTMLDKALLVFGIPLIVAACSAAPQQPVGSVPAAGAPAAARAPDLPPAAAAVRPAAGMPPAAAARPTAAGRELRVGTSGDYAPFSSHAPAGERTGFDVELAEQLARDLGVELHWVPFRWPDLSRQIKAGEFDVAMSGVTWQPARSVVGYMTRALARGGPCVLGDGAARRIAVNRGGALEAWARGHLSDRELVTADDNQSLPVLLAQGSVGAIVTDSFELRAFERPGWAARCEPALARKVYWIGPERANELGPRIDGWLRDNTARIQAAQERWFGKRQRLDAITHLVDLIARRFAFMPLVAGLKAQQGLPIDDPAREREVLDAVGRGAARVGLPEAPVRALFVQLIELSKAVQRRQSEPSTLDFKAEVRPAIGALGERILEALAEARAAQRWSELGPSELALVSPWLTESEQSRLLASLRALDDSSARPPRRD